MLGFISFISQNKFPFLSTKQKRGGGKREPKKTESLSFVLLTYILTYNILKDIPCWEEIKAQNWEETATPELFETVELASFG